MNRRIQPLLILGFAASVLSAQVPPTLSKGARVRVVFPAEPGQATRQLSGTLERLSGDTVVIVRGYLPPQAISLAGSAQLEIDASKGHGGTGALIGAIMGGAFAVEGWQSCGTCSGSVSVPGALAGAGLGALLGAFIGSRFRSASWVRVPTAGIRIVANPVRAGLTLTL